MLKTLEKYHKREAQRVLADIADLYLPDPGLSGSEPHQPDETALRVIAELRDRIGLPRDDDSPSAQSQILSAVADEITVSVLSGVNINAVKNRLAAADALPLSSFDINFPHSLSRREGVTFTEGEIAEIIFHPDQAQHFNPDILHGSARSAFSFFIKRHQDHISLVHAVRTQRSFEVTACWRIYPDVVDVSKAQSPLELLQAFAGTFGVSFSFLDRPSTKFIINTAIPLPPDTKLEHFRMEDLRLKYENVKTIMGTFNVRLSALNVLEVAIAYIIDAERYSSHLNERGWKNTEVESGTYYEVNNFRI